MSSTRSDSSALLSREQSREADSSTSARESESKERRYKLFVSNESQACALRKCN